MLKKLIYLILLFLLVAGTGYIWAQPVDVIIGTGTTSNSATGSPSPYGTYHKNFRQQYLYLSDEITNGGGVVGDISSVAFYVQDLNNCIAMSDYSIRIKQTDLNTFSTAPFETGEYQTVWYQESFMPVEGWNTHIFNTPFEWDGLSNIIVDIVTTIIDGDATQNASVHYTSMSGTALRYNHNSNDAESFTGNGSVSAWRANAHFTIAPATPDIPPNPAISPFPGNGDLAKNYTNYSWFTGGNYATGYRISIGTDGGGVATPTNIISNHDLGLTYEYTHHQPLQHSTTYYWQIVPYNGTASAFNCPIWSFTTNTPLSGNYVIGTGGDYDTFTDAINDLNFHEIQIGGGGVYFDVIPALYQEDIPPLTTTGYADAPIVIQKQSSSRLNPEIRPLSGGQNHGLRLEGISYITIDGINVSYAYNAFDNQPGNAVTCSNITIQNSTISNTSSGGIGIFFHTSGTWHNVTIQNNAVINAPTSISLTSTNSNTIIDSNTLSYISGTGISLSYTSNATITNNELSFVNSGGSSTKHGVAINAFSGGGTISNQTGVVAGNIISGGHNNPWAYPWGTFYAMNISGGDDSYYQVYNNEISNLSTNSNSPLIAIDYWCKDGEVHSNVITNNVSARDFTGIRVGYEAAVYNNKIYDNAVENANSGRGLEAINVSSSGNSPIYNNLIYDLRNDGPSVPQIIGIKVRQSAAATYGQQIYYNTLYLDAESAQENFSTAGIYSDNNRSVLEMKNNIVINKSVSGSEGIAAAIWLNESGWEQIDNATDKNIYYTEGTDQSPIIRIEDEVYPTLAAYKAASEGKDAGSYHEDVPFLSGSSPYDLNIMPNVPTNVEGNAIPIQSLELQIGFDHDNAPRDASNPDIGAFEGDYLPAPDAPHLTIQRGAEFIEIQWDAVANATAYKVYVSEDPDTFPEEPFVTVDSPGYSHPIEEHSRLFFRVTSLP